MSGSRYDFYLDRCLLPVPPDSLQISINNGNKTIKLMNEGEVNLLKAAELTDIELECLIPQVEYPFAVYRSGFQGAEYFLNYFEQLKVNGKPFQFIVSRRRADGQTLFGTNMKVSLEEYRVTEDAEEGLDLKVKIKLKQYRNYGIRTVTVKGAVTETGGNQTCSVSIRQNRSQEGAPDTGKTRSYTVRESTTLFHIAKEVYGDGSRYPEIMEANRGLVKNSLDVKPGMVLRIPALKGGKT